MQMPDVQPAPHSDGTPRGPLDVVVGDVMHHGVIACDQSMSLPAIARTMTEQQTHCVAVIGIADTIGGESLGWRFVTGPDLLAAAVEASETPTAAQLAGERMPTIESTATLRDAARVLRDERVGHLLVIEPDSEMPLGVLSTQDIIRVLGEER
jgi:CBS domain-containing protein